MVINSLQLYLRIALVTYDGCCRDPPDGVINIINGSMESTSIKCKGKCYEDQNCTAFTFEAPPPSDRYNCYTYKGGPYRNGNGRINTKCYIMERGIFIQFRI